MGDRFALVILLLSAGCSSGSGTVLDDPVQDVLHGMSECVREALDSADALVAPPAADGEDGAVKMVAPLPAALSTVVAAAQSLVTATAGKSMEPDAKAILNAAQELQTKGKTPGSAAVIKKGLEELRSKLSELKRMR